MTTNTNNNGKNERVGLKIRVKGSVIIVAILSALILTLNGAIIPIPAFISATAWCIGLSYIIAKLESAVIKCSCLFDKIVAGIIVLISKAKAAYAAAKQ